MVLGRECPKYTEGFIIWTKLFIGILKEEYAGKKKKKVNGAQPAAGCNELNAGTSLREKSENCN